MLPSHLFVATELFALLIVLVVFALLADDDTRRFNGRELVHGRKMQLIVWRSRRTVRRDRLEHEIGSIFGNDDEWVLTLFRRTTLDSLTSI